MKKDREKTYKVEEVDEEERKDEKRRGDGEGREDETTDCAGKSTNVQGKWKNIERERGFLSLK